RFINVDLPEPDGPMMATYSFRWMRRFTPRRACTCCSDPMSYVFHRSSVQIMHESGADDTAGCEKRITSAVAIFFFSCPSRDTTCSLRGWLSLRRTTHVFVSCFPPRTPSLVAGCPTQAPPGWERLLEPRCSKLVAGWERLPEPHCSKLVAAPVPGYKLLATS